ncbi:MAG TPA: hypothetical protein VFV38_05160 [Ktedonobacteraceae bacterium]|nr:hypothetical protein [Ktedonobacteraceae bacterium]
MRNTTVSPRSGSPMIRSLRDANENGLQWGAKPQDEIETNWCIEPVLEADPGAVRREACRHSSDGASTSRNVVCFRAPLVVL